MGGSPDIMFDGTGVWLPCKRARITVALLCLFSNLYPLERYEPFYPFNYW